MKKFRRLMLIGLAIILTMSLFGCNKDDEEYAQNIDASGVFANQFSNVLPQTKVADMVRTHMESGTNKKAIIIGFDGARADAMYNLVVSDNVDIGGYNVNSIYSGINYLKQSGGLYLATAGGVSEQTLQATSTSPGWATILTGKWADEHGVKDNNMALNPNTETILMEYAKKGKKATFNARWGEHFNLVYKQEFDQKKYINRKLEEENDTHLAMLKDIQDGVDIIFGIYELPDYNGHATNFSNDNYRYVKSVVDADRHAYELILEINKRTGEDWLIIMTSDHGGHKLSHGGQTETERLIYIASNKTI